MKHQAPGALILLLITVLAVVHVAANEAPLNVSRALAAQEALLAEHPGDAAAYNDYGNLLALAGRAREAEAAYRRAVALDDGFLPARFNLALLLQQRGDDEALELYRQILERDPSHAWSHYQLGVAAERRGHREQAIDHYARAFALDASLSFPRVNPHVIDNRLVTQALIHAQRYNRPPGAQVPRQYGDLDRIAGLMLDESAAEGESEAGGEDEAAEDEAGQGRPVEQPPRFDDEERPQGSGGGGAQALPRGGAERGRGATSAGSTPPRRPPGAVIERYRRPEATAGQQPPPSRGRQPPSSRGRQPPSSRGQQPPSRDAGDAPRRAPRFIPSTRSSGSLDIELRPAPAPAGRPAEARLTR